MPKASTFGALTASQVADSDSVPVLTNAGDNKKVTMANLRSVVGPGWSLTINAANEAGATNIIKLNAAIVHANNVGAKRVFVPSSMLPYDATAITFNTSVQMVREGGLDSDFDVQAYGAAGDGVTDDSTAIQAAMNDTPGGGRVFFPPGTYLHSVTLNPNNGTLIEGVGAGDALGSVLIYTGTSGPAIQIGTSTTALNYRNRVANMGILLHQPDSVGIALRQTQGCILENLYIEGYIGSYATRTNIGVSIDGLDYSSYYNHFVNVLCNHCHIGFKIHSTGTSYATQQNFVNCSAFGDYSLGDVTSIGMYFTRSPVTTAFIGNGDGTAILGGNFESYNIGIEIEGGPISIYGTRMESNATDSVYLTSTSGRNYVDVNRLTNGGSIRDDGIAGSMNMIRESDMGGWRGWLRFCPSGVFQVDPAVGSQSHELQSPSQGTSIYHRNTFGAGYTGYFIQSLISTAAATAFVHESYSSNAVDVAYLYGNGNWVNVNNSYGALSDAKLKEDIEPAKSQLEDVKLLARAMSKFRLKADHTATKQLGWVAQDVQPISPGLVYSVPARGKDGEPTGEETLAIHHSVAQLKAFKALGELIEKVEVLEAQVQRLRKAT